MAEETEAELKAKIEEMRATNIAVMKERDDLKRRFDGIDPEQIRKLEAEKARLQEEQRVKDGKLDEVWQQRETALLERVHRPVLAELEVTKGQLSAVLIDQAVVAEATKRGLRATALPDITARARSVFRLVGGVPTAFEADGQTVLRGKDGVAVKTVAEWVEALGSDAPHLFEANAGSGAAGSGSGGAASGVVNPWDRATENITEQMRLMRSDPRLAARLKASAKR